MLWMTPWIRLIAIGKTNKQGVISSKHCGRKSCYIVTQLGIICQGKEAKIGQLFALLIA